MLPLALDDADGCPVKGPPVNDTSGRPRVVQVPSVVLSVRDEDNGSYPEPAVARPKEATSPSPADGISPSRDTLQENRG